MELIREKYLGGIFLNILWFTTLQMVISKQDEVPFTECRFTMRASRGIIVTPNFPDPYPVPLSCQWVIEAPADKVIAVYFTQFYMREGLKATEYAYYSSSVKMGKTEFGTIGSDHEPTYLVTNKPVLVLNFSIREIANIHMRVREFLLDVFGFNITYEMIARNESIRKDACLYHHCSFTGNCFATSGFDRYYCQCFAKYFGDECQYDTECGPTSRRNICQNGGTCRYYIGSTVRTCECPIGYDGATCDQIRTTPRPPSLCGGKECSSLCTNASFPGIELDVQKKCSKKEGRRRYIISLKVTHPKVEVILKETRKTENFKKEMERALRLLIKPRLSTTQNITVIDLRDDFVMKFHLLGKVSDEEELKTTIEEMLKVGQLGSFVFDPGYFALEEEPALQIQRIEASEKMPLVEGSELTLACVIQGSSSLQVEWFKDLIPINVHNTQRGTWTTIVPKNSEEQFTALLGFDSVNNVDSGTFMCRVRDWGFVLSKTMKVYVQSAPQPQLSPMASSIFKGDQLVITCLSKEDVHGTFGYTWLKNGQILNPSVEPEMVEDLFPAGSRILLHAAKSSATYTCIITSSAGSTRKDTVITVLEKERNVSLCLPEEYRKVRWSLTASNTKDIQTCPAGYTGDVKRHCQLTTLHGALWEDPDFSGCFSSQFLAIKRKVDSLGLGYLLSDTTSLLEELKHYILLKEQRLQPSEGEPIVDLLQDIQEVADVDGKGIEGWQVFLDIVSTLLSSFNLIRKHSKFIKLHNQIFLYGFRYAGARNDTTFEIFRRKAFAVEVGRLHQAHHVPLAFPTQRYSHLASYARAFHDNLWLKDSVELDFPRMEMQHDFLERNSTTAIVVVFYRNLSSYLPERFVTKRGIVDVEYQLISSMIGIHMKDATHLPNSLMNVKVKLSRFNYTLGAHTGWNISCAMVDFTHGSIRFTSSGCQMLWTSRNITLCNCHKLGTYALLLTHFTPPVETNVHSRYEVVAGIGSAICAFFILLTFFILLSCWRTIKGAITALKLQVCIALLGTYGVFFCGLHGSLSQDYYPYTVTLIEFFLLTAFSLQLCIGLTVYVECIDLKDVYFSSYKITAIGWAVPVIVLGATLAAQSLEGFVLESWWLTLGSNFFYAYTSSTLILTMFQILLFVIVKVEIRNYGKVSDLLQKKKIRINGNKIRLLHRSLLITSALLLLSLASILYVNFSRYQIFEYFFSSSSAVLGLVVFLCYTVYSEKNFLHCCSDHCPEENSAHEEEVSRSRNSSFKSFLKPEIIDDNYTNKLKVDIEKRKERIESMYNQIERASLTKETERDLEYVVNEGSVASWPLEDQSAKCSPHRVAESTLLRRNSGNDCYLQTKWNYGDYSPHACKQSLLSATDPFGEEFPESRAAMYQTFLDCESDSNYEKQPDDFTVTYMDDIRRCDGSSANSGYPSFTDFTTDDRISVESVPTYQTTIKTHISSSAVKHSEKHMDKKITDIRVSSANNLVNSQCISQEYDDQDSIKNSCFLPRTDSLETVVYCGKGADSESVSSATTGICGKVPSNSNVTNDGRRDSHKNEKTLLWNMTTV